MTIDNGTLVRIIDQAQSTSTTGHLMDGSLSAIRNGQYGQWTIQQENGDTQQVSGRIYRA